MTEWVFVFIVAIGGVAGVASVSLIGAWWKLNYYRQPSRERMMNAPVLKNLGKPVASVSIAKPGDVIVIESKQKIWPIPTGYTMYTDNLIYRIADGNDPSPYVADQNIEIWVIDGDSIELTDPDLAVKTTEKEIASQLTQKEGT